MTQWGVYAWLALLLSLSVFATVLSILAYWQPRGTTTAQSIVIPSADHWAAAVAHGVNPLTVDRAFFCTVIAVARSELTATAPESTAVFLAHVSGTQHLSVPASMRVQLSTTVTASYLDGQLSINDGPVHAVTPTVSVWFPYATFVRTVGTDDPQPLRWTFRCHQDLTAGATALALTWREAVTYTKTPETHQLTDTFWLSRLEFAGYNEAGDLVTRVVVSPQTLRQQQQQQPRAKESMLALDSSVVTASATTDLSAWNVHATVDGNETCPATPYTFEAVSKFESLQTRLVSVTYNMMLPWSCFEHVVPAYFAFQGPDMQSGSSVTPYVEAAVQDRISGVLIRQCAITVGFKGQTYGTLVAYGWQNVNSAGAYIWSLRFRDQSYYQKPVDFVTMELQFQV